jgi:hypothetical protein
MDTDQRQNHADDLDGIIEAAQDFQDDSIAALLGEARARMDREIADDTTADAVCGDPICDDPICGGPWAKPYTDELAEAGFPGIGDWIGSDDDDDDTEDTTQ